MRLEDIIISINTNVFLIIAGILILAAYSFYVYKFTIPRVSPFQRYLLLSLRIISLILLFLIIFEPVVNLKSRETIEPVTYLFVDNSNSIAAKDSIIRSETVKNMLSELNTAGGKMIPFLFDKKIKTFRIDSTDALNFKGQATNFYNIISEIKNSEENISSAVIISDGILNDGSSPIFEAEKLNIPLFTVGIGDSSKYRDVRISDVIFNQYIYAQKPTNIDIIISQFGFDNRSVRATLFENDKPVSAKDAQLNYSGISKINFEYTPQNSGETRMSIRISPIAGEENTINNSKTFFIDVLKNKAKVCLIAGSPSADLSSISNALDSDENIEVKKIIQVAHDKFWKDYNLSLIDSSEIIFLVDFPSSNSPQALLDYISNQIENKNKPFFFLFTQSVDIGKLKNIEPLLPFTILKIGDGFTQVEPNFTGGSFLSTGLGITLKRENVLDNLPPVIKNNSTLEAKPGSDVIARSIIRNLQISSPLLVTRNVGNQRSIAFLAGGVWKWELSTSEKYPEFFKSMIGDFVKWLGITHKQKQFSIRTSKKIYSINEPVEFIAELYDQTFSPIDTANINVSVSKEGQEYEIIFSPEKNGIYNAVFDLTSFGDYTFSGRATINGKVLQSEIGKFSIGETNIEKDNTRMDEDFLKLLSLSSNGKYFRNNEIDELKNEITKVNATASTTKINISEINFRLNEWIMLFIICLFAVEWFIRKRSGML